MRRVRTLAISIGMSLLTTSSALATPPSPASISQQPTFPNVVSRLNNKISFGRGCDGQTDYPHVSKHVRLTVNVEALTECPGKEVFITTTISRHSWWIFNETKTVSGKGFQKIKVNVALPCKWKSGQAPILYVVTSHHSESSGAQQNTETKASIKC
jgi:hypothetical protein